MQLLIFEGVATSGKSTVINRAKECLGNNISIRVAGEPETHIPIMRQTDELHIEFFENLVERLVAEKPGLIIFDRLYLTQAFRAGVSLERYSSLESTLSKLGALTVFLKVDSEAIADRIARAAEHRDPTWGEYIKTKGSNINDIASYYTEQQQNQMKLLATSSLPYIICDTANHDYADVTQRILKELQLK